MSIVCLAGGLSSGHILFEGAPLRNSGDIQISMVKSVEIMAEDSRMGPGTFGKLKVGMLICYPVGSEIYCYRLSARRRNINA